MELLSSSAVYALDAHLSIKFPGPRRRAYAYAPVRLCAGAPTPMRRCAYVLARSRADEYNHATNITMRDRRSRGAVSRAAGDQNRGFKNTVYAVHVYTKLLLCTHSYTQKLYIASGTFRVGSAEASIAKPWIGRVQK